MLKLRGIYKKIHNKEILKDLNLEVKENEIFGFLGPNGAGKSTTMKIICGLIKPDKGEVLINNININENRIEALKNLGALIESPKIYSFFSARENLMQIARIEKINENEVDKVLDLVGLKYTNSLKVKNFSLGMKQRLGIAQAIIGNKKILILDEPTNGLDANGVIEFRNMLKTLVKTKNISVFISSHKLDEIEKICDEVAFLENGTIKSIQSIKNQLCKEILISSQIYNIENLIKNNNLKLINFEISNEKIKIICENKRLTSFLSFLINNDINLSSIIIKEKSLEEKYLNLMEGDYND
ncbi:ABC transporter ATP-binding protein [Eubacterium multiforme]|uniref:ABC-2 type transport system ATP-binding protein n=1 Tax=Eubacterium multiforme TaxID=83339 RepID=A0ABT9UVP7_9FIRM|nr:ABC transporter ATP-binding protein [Eubacterium multiforme]MDQ0150396.1 ABC-2 type transport system ATP-binding protein [Eubacterium multiforme]